MELNIRLDQSRKHLYEQIYEYIREEIIRGELHKDEKLPSSRSLAANLGVARSTVDFAYSQLADEGYIKARRSSGFYVCGIETVPGGAGNLSLSAAEEAPKTPETGESLHSGSDMYPAGSPAGAGAIDFSIRDIDMTAFPYATWRRILRGLMGPESADLFGKGDPQGDIRLREMITHYLHLSRGVVCSPGQVVIGAGNDYLLTMLRFLIGEKKTVAMENPSYLRAARIFQGLNYKVEYLPSDGDGISPLCLEKSGCDLAYVMPAHQFPMGTVMPYTRRAELLKWAASAEERYLIEDDYDSEFRYRGRPIPALQSMDSIGKVIYFGTFSKSIAPAIRVGYMVLPGKLAAEFADRCGFLSSTVSRVDQSVLEAFISGGYFERHLNRMRNRYKEKHDYLLKCLAVMEQRFEILGAGAGLHILLREKKAPDGCVRGRERELAECAKNAGVIVYPLHEFYEVPGDYPDRAACRYTGAEGRAAILLGFAALTDDQIREGVSRLKALLHI